MAMLKVKVDLHSRQDINSKDDGWIWKSLLSACDIVKFSTYSNGAG